MACSYNPLETAQRSAFAPALIAAYALGAKLWAPVLVVAAEVVLGALAWVLPKLPLDTAHLFVIMWAVRFTLYVIGTRSGWNYGYGVNGVIVNRGLTLPEKGRRIVTDWFGIVLIAMWLWFMPGVLEAAMILS